jgi:hypothetical protein
MGRVPAASEDDKASFGPFLSSDVLETGIETFSNTLRSSKIAGQVCRPHEALKHFLDLSDIITEKRQIRK